MTVVVIGGGAAGFFGAIACAEAYPEKRVILLEKARQVLSKVRISGGGRCNVTHACFESQLLVQNYPRGHKALRGPFSRFQPKDTIQWFQTRGVELKIEADGRMFPITDNSETIIQCFLSEIKRVGVDLRTEWGVESIQKKENQFLIISTKGESILADKVLMATGSTPKVYQWLENLGHRPIPAVPSLFTFHISDFSLDHLAGISVPKAMVKIANTSLEQQGPLLITHWGFSGPAILKLSAWGARFLHEKNYKGTLIVNWLPELSQEALKEKLLQSKKESPQKLIVNECPFDFAKNLWKALLLLAEIPESLKWVNLSHKQVSQMTFILQQGHFQIDGKSTYKDEFVTCGGINLDEVNFKTMESRLCPGLYFAGEILDIDGVTGGFNFQNAWTTSWVAAQSIGLTG